MTGGNKRGILRRRVHARALHEHLFPRGTAVGGDNEILLRNRLKVKDSPAEKPATGVFYPISF
jgi:hypothetical protein